MGLYFLGDVHGDPIMSLSYKKNPKLKNLTHNDTIVQLGDFGVPFFNSEIKSGHADYMFSWIDSKPYNFIVVGGNHENYDYWESCPIVDIFGGKARQATIKDKSYNIYFIDSPTILTIDNKKLLCLPKGNSHDIDNLLNPKDANFNFIKKKLNKRLRNGDYTAHYRVIGETWWPQEKINVGLYNSFIDEHINEHFDFVCSHIPPAFVSQYFYGGIPSEGERYFEIIYEGIDFDCWAHGHLHNMYYNKLNSIAGFYSTVINSNDIENLRRI